MNDLEKRFLHHPPTTPAVIRSHELARRTFLATARVIEQLPESRERSSAMTKLEEASFWVHAAIARGQTSFPAVRAAIAAAAAAKPEDAPPITLDVSTITPAPRAEMDADTEVTR